MATIRDATLDDRDVIHDVHVASVRGIDTAEYTDAELAIWKTSLSPAMYSISDRDTSCLVADVESNVGGFGEVSLADPELDKLYVDPAVQRRGIASALVEEIERRVRDHGGNSLYVEASLNAVPFYERVGFQQTDTHEKSITAGTESAELTVADMTKSLR